MRKFILPAAVRLEGLRIVEGGKLYISARAGPGLSLAGRPAEPDLSSLKLSSLIRPISFKLASNTDVD